MYKPEDFDIIDMHTHPYTSPEQVIGRFWKPDSIEDFVRELNKVGIKKFAGSVIFSSKPELDFNDTRKLNEDALRVRDQYPDAYIPGIHVHSAYPQESCAMLHEMHAQGVRLIGELVPYHLGTDQYSCPAMLEIYAEAAKLDMVVNIHSANEDLLGEALRKFPDLNFIIAHPGDTATSPGRFDFVSRYKNLYIDISGTGLFRWGMLRYGIDVCGADKILFGSDMPTCSPGMNVYGVLSENLTFDELKLIFGDNFRKLMKMA